MVVTPTLVVKTDFTLLPSPSYTKLAFENIGTEGVGVMVGVDVKVGVNVKVGVKVKVGV